MNYTEFILKIYNFVDSIKMVYITIGFALIGLMYSKAQNKKLNKECQRLTALNLEYEKNLKNDK